MSNLFEIKQNVVDRVLQREMLRADFELPYDVTAQMVEQCTGNALLAFKTYIQTEKCTTDVEVVTQVYATWIDHLISETFLSKFFKPKMKSLTVKQQVNFYALYPKFKGAGNMPYTIVREYPQKILY
jgi:hypothetical protein